ncbi:hypothetical protein [Ferruginibacter albus]|uniref:hypothetical protein n=1 Tax=Ferruginibacter albus TaxID=2875540 RepID=UPI001CC6E780|nr:hypothetical protein [Ferruginibacter albus]UAY52878.1 hypothetical protein K9M53_04165 [Ferruginibacter albus]
METIRMSLEDFRQLSDGNHPESTTSIVNKIKQGYSYIIVGNKKEFKLILYKDADGKEIIGLNEV